MAEKIDPIKLAESLRAKMTPELKKELAGGDDKKPGQEAPEQPEAAPAAAKTEVAAEATLTAEGPLDASAAEDLERKEAIEQAPAPAEAGAAPEKTEEPHPFGERPYTKEEEREIYGPKEKTSEDFLKDLEGPRLAYVRGEKKLKEVEQKVKNLEKIRGGSKIGQQRKVEIENEYEQFKKEFEPIKGNYDKTLNDYQKSLYLKKEAELANDLEKDKKLNEYAQTELYEETLFNESQRVNEAKQENLSPKEKKWYYDCLYKFSQLPKEARWAISAGVATGVAFSFGGVVSTTLGAYFAVRLGRGVLGGIGGALTDKVLGKRIEKQKVATEKEIKSEIGEKIETAKGFEEIMKIYSERSPEVLKKLEAQRAKEHNQHVKKTIATLLVAGGTSAGLGFLENYLTAHGYLEALGVKPKGPGLVPEKKPGVLQPGEKPAGGGQPGGMLGGVEQPAAPQFQEMLVGKGESPLLLAKQMYINNADSLGYKPEMGDIKNWAEIASTRHIVGQYISERPLEYEDLIKQIGEPPEDPIKLDQWLQKVPKGTFDEILHEKVPNLVYEDDFVRVTESGDIVAYGPDGEERLGHIEVFKASAPTAEAEGELREIKVEELPTLKEAPLGSEKFYETQANIENTIIAPEEQAEEFSKIPESIKNQVEEIQAKLDDPNLEPNQKSLLSADIRELGRFEKLVEKKIDMFDKGEVKPMAVKELLPQLTNVETDEAGHVTRTFIGIEDRVDQIENILEVNKFSDLLPKDKKLMDELFVRYLGHSFKDFQGLPATVRDERLIELGMDARGLIGQESRITEAQLPYKAFLWRNIGEMHWVQMIWERFGGK